MNKLFSINAPNTYLSHYKEDTKKTLSFSKRLAFSSYLNFSNKNKFLNIFLRFLRVIRGLWKEESVPHNILSFIAPPRVLRVPKLPTPHFQMPKLPRFFGQISGKVRGYEGYADACLISEMAEDLPKPIANSAHILSEAVRLLPQSGVLKQNKQGFIYLELPDTYVALSALIQDPLCVPFVYADSSLAHIPVVLPYEWTQQRGPQKLQELNTTFTFKINGVCSVTPQLCKDIDKIYFLRISSLDLEFFRKSLLLPARLRGHEFHMVLGCKRAVKTRVSKQELFRLNVSCYAA